MNILRVLLLLCVLLIGLVIGGKNADEIELNFVLTTLHTTVGIAIIVSLLVGVILGSGIVLFFTVVPTYAKLRSTHKALAQAQVNDKTVPGSKSQQLAGTRSQPIKKE